MLKLKQFLVVSEAVSCWLVVSTVLRAMQFNHLDRHVLVVGSMQPGLGPGVHSLCNMFPAPLRSNPR